jgi:hypothetical protein
MSEERRKRQQERASGASSGEKSTRYIAYGVVLVLFAAAFFAGRYYKNHKYDSFAKCLASKGAKMYGLYWCPHCADQKRMFGDAFRNVPYVECAVGEPGNGKLAPQCQAAGLKLFPSWQFGNEPPKEGVLSLEELSAKTGCSLP